MRVGAATEEPAVIRGDDGRWHFHADEGNQCRGSSDAAVVDTNTNPSSNPDAADGVTLALLEFDSAGLALTAIGVLRGIVGLEGLTATDFSRIAIEFTPSG